MATMKTLRQIASCGACFIAGSALLYMEYNREQLPLPVESLTASNTYLGPIRPGPNADQLIKVEVLLRDSPKAGGHRIASVEFDGKSIPLMPPDIYGNRGSGSFQVKPGTYKLTWKVNLEKSSWPRTAEHEEEVTVSSRDLWLQITIEGDEASIR